MVNMFVVEFKNNKQFVDMYCDMHVEYNPASISCITRTYTHYCNMMLHLELLNLSQFNGIMDSTVDLIRWATIAIVAQ